MQNNIVESEIIENLIKSDGQYIRTSSYNAIPHGGYYKIRFTNQDIKYIFIPRLNKFGLSLIPIKKPSTDELIMSFGNIKVKLLIIKKRIYYLNLKFIDNNENLIGSLEICYPGNDRWYKLTFEKQKISISYTFEFAVYREEKLIFSPRYQFDDVLFREIHPLLPQKIFNMDIEYLCKLFVDAYNNQMPSYMSWLESLMTLKPKIN